MRQFQCISNSDADSVLITCGVVTAQKAFSKEFSVTKESTGTTIEPHEQINIRKSVKMKPLDSKQQCGYCLRDGCGQHCCVQLRNGRWHMSGFSPMYTHTVRIPQFDAGAGRYARRCRRNHLQSVHSSWLGWGEVTRGAIRVTNTMKPCTKVVSVAGAIAGLEPKATIIFFFFFVFWLFVVLRLVVPSSLTHTQ